MESYGDGSEIAHTSTKVSTKDHGATHTHFGYEATGNGAHTIVTDLGDGVRHKRTIFGEDEDDAAPESRADVQLINLLSL